MNKNFIPTPQDEELRLESVITKTADFNGAVKDNGPTFAPGGIGMAAAAVINISAQRADGDETYNFVLEESADNSTWTAAGPIMSVDVSGLSATLGVMSVPGWLSKRYHRLHLDVGGTTPSITYEAWLNYNLM